MEVAEESGTHNEPVEVHQEQDSEQAVQGEEVGGEHLLHEEARGGRVHHLPRVVVQPSDEPAQGAHI